MANKIFGFTLAEVLVTLGIIGVVSALTIPTFVRNHQKQVYVAQLKKAYSIIAQAADLAFNDTNAVTLAETKYNRSEDEYGLNFMQTYFKVANVCEDSSTPCFAENYKTLNGQTFRGIGKRWTSVSLANGMSIQMWGMLSDHHYGDIIHHGYSAIYVDINGPEGPNVVGRDLFYLELYSDGKLDDGYYNDKSDFCDGEDVTYGLGCLDKIINAGWKMDY